MPRRWSRSGVGAALRSVSDLAGRSGAGAAALQRLAWAGACDSLVEDGAAPVDPDRDLRRPALWAAGGAARAARTGEGAQLALALDGSATPPLPPLGPWDRIVADYRTTGMTLGKHPMELLREGLPAEVLSSAAIARTRDGARVKVAGMVVARQRPATANGVVFMLLEDENGTINLIVPPPVVERCRLAVRTSGFVQAAGKLEHREGTTNVVVSRIDRLQPPEAPDREAAAHRPADSPRDGQAGGRCRPRSPSAPSTACGRRRWRSWPRRCRPRTASAGVGASRGRAWWS